MGYDVELNIKLFGERKRIDLYQIPYDPIFHLSNNRQIKEKYIDWIKDKIKEYRYYLNDFDKRNEFTDSIVLKNILELEEHIRKVEFYSEHQTAIWTYE